MFGLPAQFQPLSQINVLAIPAPCDMWTHFCLFPSAHTSANRFWFLFVCVFPLQVVKCLPLSTLNISQQHIQYSMISRLTTVLRRMFARYYCFPCLHLPFHSVLDLHLFSCSHHLPSAHHHIHCFVPLLSPTLYIFSSSSFVFQNICKLLLQTICEIRAIQWHNICKLLILGFERTQLHLHFKNPYEI